MHKTPVVSILCSIAAAAALQAAHPMALMQDTSIVQPLRSTARWAWLGSAPRARNLPSGDATHLAKAVGDGIVSRATILKLRKLSDKAYLA